MTAARITSFLVKIASRCNLDCDYCYVYHHADQSWRSMPRVLSAGHRTAFAGRLAEYAREASLSRCVVVLHGGEPLLAGADTIVSFVEELRAALDAGVELDVGMQTNGVLLTDEIVEKLAAAGVSISLSVDGPREANDLHRNSRRGRSSFDRTMNGLELLKARPNVFAGIIAVIDPSVPPETLLAFFDEHRPPKLDFLLPDAHHNRPPPGRDANAGLYRDWLLRAFDLWLFQYPHLPVRTFEALLDSVVGLASGTDAFGLGDVTLLSIETDGTYHDLDVLKVVGQGATRLEGSVDDTPISLVAGSPAIAAHRGLLSKDGLSATCQACAVVDVCGGGSLPHRFGPNGFDHPSVYCDELLALITHVRRRLSEQLDVSTAVPPSRLSTDFDLGHFELAETAGSLMSALRDDARHDHAVQFDNALELVEAGPGNWASTARDLRRLPFARRLALAAEPGTVAWSRAFSAVAMGRTVHDVDGNPLNVDASYLDVLARRATAELPALTVGLDDPWLRAPFGKAITFEAASVAKAANPLVAKALALVNEWRPALAAEITETSRAIQFVRDPTAHPEKIVSFSDTSVPGALYVSVIQGERLIDPYDLADSLIHEHRHQKLYLLERFAPMVTSSTALVVSPWREDLRPPSGLLHAIFVFIELRRFWIHVRDQGDPRVRTRAVNQLRDTDQHLAEGFETLGRCALTEVGRELAAVLDRVRRRDPAAA